MSDDFNYLVRIQGTNLDGTKNIVSGLCGIKGVGIRIAHAVVKALGIDPDKRLGALSDADVKRLATALGTPSSVGARQRVAKFVGLTRTCQ